MGKNEMLEGIFIGHYDVPLDIKVLDIHIMKPLMSQGEFVKIVTKMMQGTSRGKPFETIDEMKSYYGVNNEV